MNEKLIESLEAKGFKRWTKLNYNRLYISASELHVIEDVKRDHRGIIRDGYVPGYRYNKEELRYLDADLARGDYKVYIDLADGKVHAKGNSDRIVDILIEKVEEILSEAEKELQAEEKVEVVAEETEAKKEAEEAEVKGVKVKVEERFAFYDWTKEVTIVMKIGDDEASIYLSEDSDFADVSGGRMKTYEKIISTMEEADAFIKEIVSRHGYSTCRKFSDLIAKHLAAEEVEVEEVKKAPEEAGAENKKELKMEKENDMVLVEGGTFQMGGNDYVAHDIEKPVHTVTVSSFYMSKYPVTQAEYQAVMGNNPSHFKGDQRPVDSVSWYEAVEYCNKRSEKEGLTPCYTIDGDDGDDVTCNWEANGYRLPTEAEWEYAARGGKHNSPYKYSGSDNIDEVAWYRENSRSETHEVGKKKANVLGIHDMNGNVEEWCWDWFDEDYYSNSPENNPLGPASSGYRVLRGGTRNDYGCGCRNSKRASFRPGGRVRDWGFRVVRGGEKAQEEAGAEKEYKMTKEDFLKLKFSDEDFEKVEKFISNSKRKRRFGYMLDDGTILFRIEVYTEGKGNFPEVYYSIDTQEVIEFVKEKGKSFPVHVYGGLEHAEYPTEYTHGDIDWKSYPAGYDFKEYNFVKDEGSEDPFDIYLEKRKKACDLIEDGNYLIRKDKVYLDACDHYQLQKFPELTIDDL